MDERRVFDISGVNDAWQGMWRGLRAYGVALTVIWTACATSVLAVLAVVAGTWWLHLVCSLGAAVELALSALTLRWLIRSSNQGRLDT